MVSRRLVGVVLASLVLPPAVFAQQDPNAASALFKAGREAAKQKDYVTACARFAESYRLDPAPGTVLNLADCEEKQGHVASAWQRYKQSAEQLPQGDPRIQPALQRATELEPRVPHITIRLAPSAPADTRVTRDGLELGRASLGLPLPVDPGEHRVIAVATGRSERIFPVSCAEGQTKELVVEPGSPLTTVAPSASAPPAKSAPQAASSAPASTPPPIAPLPPPSSPTLGYALLGVGGVGLLVAGITGAMVSGRQKTADEHCPSNQCDQEGYDAARSGRTLIRVNSVAWAAGLVGLGAGLYFVLSGPSRSPAASLGGAWLPGGGGLVARGSF